MELLMTAYRAGNGKFVSRDNPIAVAARLNGSHRAAQLAAAREAYEARRSNARRHGYAGPLTRAELAAMVRP